MKLKRLLTAALSAVMALSVCALPAMAAGTTSTSTFDPSITTGTLTINKYEQTKEEENSAENGTPLDGVEFTIYQLATVKQVKNTNGSIGLEYTPTINELPSIDFDGDTDPTTGKIDSKALYNKISPKITDTVKNQLEEAGLKHSATTGADGAAHGQAKFENLPLGIYMVEETKAPSQILSYTANFIVSIPMMNDDNKTWNYAVVAEPKNVPTYGGVKLVKTGRVAGDDGSSGTGLEGVLFRLDIKGTDGKWTPVDLDAKKVTFGAGEGTSAQVSSNYATNGYIKTGANGVINITGGLAPATYRFVELEAVNGYIADASTAHEFEVYYDKTDKQLYIKENNAKVDAVKVINERPDLEKNITKRDNKTSTTHDADYGIGDKVPYTLTIKVPNTIDKLNTFKVTDTVNAKQLIYSDDFKVSVTKKGGTEVPLDEEYYNKTLTNNGDSIVTGTRSVEFDFRSTATGKTLLGADYADAVITIKYTAKLLDGAAIGNEGNINNAKLTYSNKTNVDADGKTTTPKDNESNDAGVVYTFQTGIKKVDQNNKPLNGVKFDLYKKVETTDEVSADRKGIIFNGVPKEYVAAATVKALNLSSDDTEKWVKITEVTSGGKDPDTGNPKGEAIVKGLPNGTYKFVETETLKGYNLLKDPVDATLSIAYTAKWDKKDVYDADGKLIKRTYSTTEKAFDDVNMKIYTVVNRKGFNLPVTGGFGTLLFSGIGVLLVLAGVSVLFSLKKKNNRA